MKVPIKLFKNHENFSKRFSVVLIIHQPTCALKSQLTLNILQSCPIATTCNYQSSNDLRLALANEN